MNVSITKLVAFVGHLYTSGDAHFPAGVVTLLVCYLQGKLYVFDKVFKPNASQEKIYNEAAKSIVKGVYLEHWSGACFSFCPLN